MDTIKKEKIKIAIVSHALVIPVFQNRWKRLAEDPNYEVHLLIPRYWEQTWFGEKIIYRPNEEHLGNFHVHPMKTTSKRNWIKYFFYSIDAKLLKIKPDLIYIIHEENVWIHHQIYLYKKLFSPKSQIIFFSMNARGMNLKKPHKKWMWNQIKKNTQAALVHYPGCLKSLRNMGYKKPIFLQTQVGVDENLFKPNLSIRKEYREKLCFENKFVIGYTGRLTNAKGIDDLISILPLEGIDWALLLVGNGNLKKEIEQITEKNGWQDRVHITGFVDQAEVPKYMNAMDIFLLGSKTMPDWVDTFPLVTVQAQACGVPILASNSGSIPWQLNNTALFFSEGNKEELKRGIYKLVKDQSLRNELVDKGRIRSLNYFCHEGMTKSLKKIIKQVLNDSYIFHNKNEEYKQWKAY